MLHFTLTLLSLTSIFYPSTVNLSVNKSVNLLYIYIRYPGYPIRYYQNAMRLLILYSAGNWRKDYFEYKPWQAEE